MSGCRFRFDKALGRGEAGEVRGTLVGLRFGLGVSGV